MKFTIDRKALSAAMSLAVKAQSSQTVQPILSCVLLTAAESRGGVTVTGTGPEGTVSVLVRCGVERDGTAAVARDAAKWVSDRRSETIAADSDDGGRVVLSDDWAEYRETAAVDTATFPLPAEIEAGSSAVVSAPVLLSVLKPVLFAAETWADSRHTTHQAAVALFLDASGGVMAGATDRTVFAAAGGCGPQVGKMMVPAGAARLMVGLLEPLASDVTVSFLTEGRGLHMATETGWVRCPAAASGFPPFHKVLDTLKPLPHTLGVNAASLAAAVKSAAVAMDRHLARLELQAGGGRLTVTGVGDTRRTSAWVECPGDTAPFALCGRRMREMTAAIADAGDDDTVAELVLDGDTPDVVGLIGGGVSYVLRTLSAVEE